MRQLSLLTPLLLLATAASASDTVIYRCTGGDGQVALQSMPCPAGSKSEVRRLSADYAPPPVSFPAVLPISAQPAAISTAGNAPATAAAPPPVATPPAPAAPAVMALPALHQCKPRSGPDYYTDRLEETVRCVPLRVTGLDGNPDTGAGQACEVQRDRCQTVPEADACHAWGVYLTQSRERFAQAPSRSSAETDTQSAQIALLLASSACAQAPAQNP